MKSSIYIATERLEVIGYQKNGNHVKIEDYASLPLSEGTMINGKITDSTELVEKLSVLRAEKPLLFKNVSLVIDGNSLITKKFPVPNLKKSHYYQLVREDLEETTENVEELIFDYSIIEKTAEKEINLLACGTDKSTIESYTAVFEEAGISLFSIAVGLETILNFVKSQPELMKKTFVFNVVDGFSMLSVIFEKGTYIFSTRTRLVGENNEEVLLTILEGISPLIQFNKSQQLSDIEASYYLGLDEEQIDFMQKVSSRPEVEIECLDVYRQVQGSEKITDACHFSFLGIISEKKGMNLISSYKNNEKNKKERKKISPLLVIPSVLALVFVIAIAFPVIQTFILNQKIGEAKAYLENPEVVAKSNELDKIASETGKLNSLIAQIDEKSAEIGKKPVLNNPVLNIIMNSSASTVSISSFSFDESSGIIHVVGTSATESNSSEYVDLIKKGEMISDVYYTGYSYDNTAEKRFNFAIDVVLKQG